MTTQKKEGLDEQLVELNHLYETAPVGLCLLDRELRYVRINERLAEINGKPVSEHVGRLLQEVIPEIAPKLEPVLRNVLETGEPVLNTDIQGATSAEPDVEHDWLCSYFPLIGADGTVRGITVVVQEITEWKQAQRALQEARQERERHVEERTREIQEANQRLTREVAERLQAEHRFRSLLEATPDAMVIAGQDGKIVLINNQTERLFGYARDELVGQGVEKLVPERFRDRHAGHREDYHRDPLPRPMGAGGELAGRHKDGREFSIEISLSPLRTEEGLLTIASVRDITERKRAEQILRESEAALRLGNEKIHYLAGELINSQEKERRRIALDLHDDVTQKLAALSIAHSKLEKKLSQPASVMRETIANLKERTAAIILDLRQLSRQLHPAGLEYVGLSASLRSLCQDFGEDITIQLDVPDSIGTVPSDVALCLYRVAQESLHNVRRHSDAATVHVKLARVKGRLRLDISDDGVGFDVDEARRSGSLGLFSMEERARHLEGSFRIQSRPGAGTQLEVLVPVSKGK